MSERMAQCDIFCGINGCGKTTLLKKIVLSMLKNGHRILIITPDPKEWRNVPEIHYKHKHHIATYTGIRRIVYYKGCLEDVRQYYGNGVLVLDDARAYIHAQTDDTMMWLQIRRRQAEIDLFAVFHGLTQVPPVFFTFLSNLFLFYTADNIKRRGVYIDENLYAEIQEAKADVLSEVNKGNEHYYKRIILDKRLLKNKNNG